MACNENIIKNMANEVSRNCQAHNVAVDPEFVIHLIELLLLNPKYGKLFTKTLNRNNLEYFVNECVSMLTRGGTSINTLKMQFILKSNYDHLDALVAKHLHSVDSCLLPLRAEIFDAEPEDEEEFKKLFRKISIYIILASGLGSPSFIVTLKEGMSALESVFSMEDLHVFVALPNEEKLEQLEELVAITSGVRLFNRDCKRGGEGIPDLPFNLMDAGKACLASLTNSLITVMQRVNSLTSAVEDSIGVDSDTGVVVVNVPQNCDLTLEDYTNIFELLAFHRQYEVYIRQLLADVESVLRSSSRQVDRVRVVLDELHNAVKYKAAVPVVTVFPLFTKLWNVWHTMQSLMYLMSTVNRVISSLAGLHDVTKIPFNVLENMLKGKMIMTDHDRLLSQVSVHTRLSLSCIPNYLSHDSAVAIKDKDPQFVGFCTMCLSVGALIPSNVWLGMIKHRGRHYGFSGIEMALQFAKDPQRYVNAALDYARNNPHVITLLNMEKVVHEVKDVENLVAKYVPKVKVFPKEIQTETHPIEENIQKEYSWDLWEWKRKACKWATVVNCRTHSTQTQYSHLRSEIHSQTVEPRHKCLQTMREQGVSTVPNKVFLWGLRGQWEYGQHRMRLDGQHSPDRKKAQDFEVCKWPCYELSESTSRTNNSDDKEQLKSTN